MRQQIASSSEVRPRVGVVNQRPYTGADLGQHAVGNRIGVADQVRYMRNSDRFHGPSATDRDCMVCLVVRGTEQPLLPARVRQIGWGCSVPALGGRYAPWRGAAVTLSVSISTIGSPLATRSPGAFSHRSTLPVSCASSSAGMMTFVGIAYLPPSAESPGAICESPSCTTDATSAPSHVNTLPRAIARPPALDATYCE